MVNLQDIKKFEANETLLSKKDFKMLMKKLKF